MRIRTTDNESGELINISSMLDVMFILIIFFLVTTTFKEEEVDHLVNLPVEARNQSLTQTAGNLIKINIRENGSYVVMGQQITEEDLSKWMGTEIDKKPELKVLIRCDADSKHLYLANVMSICRHTGVPKMNIAVRTEK
ncbi:MAG: biopolymer transporter ExbD [Akkermansiaceae bacterium]|nr:biopolymer transporter ExbD [Roseibacillus sp.]|tara:strand:+ start:136 stop:552 length:417 start_codon:yes stop_codon:yes gene_type:complete